MGDDYRTTLVFVDPDYLDGGISDAQIHENANGATTTSNTARRISEHAVNGGGQDEIEEGPLVDRDVAAAQAKHDHELDRMIRETKTRIGRYDILDATARRNVFVRGHDMMRAAFGPEPEGHKFVEPERAATYEPASNASTGFGVVSKRRRTSRAA
jgi:hypothetical protein